MSSKVKVETQVVISYNKKDYGVFELYQLATDVFENKLRERVTADLFSGGVSYEEFNAGVNHVISHLLCNPDILDNMGKAADILNQNLDDSEEEGLNSEEEGLRIINETDFLKTLE